KLDQVSGGKLQAGCATMPEINDDAEGCGQGNPHAAPNQRLAKAHRVRPPVEDPEVQRQHGKHKQIEENPKQQHDLSQLAKIVQQPSDGRPCPSILQGNQIWLKYRQQNGPACRVAELVSPAEADDSSFSLTHRLRGGLMNA